MQNTRFRIRAGTGALPAPLSLERSADGRLSARVSSEQRIVYVQRCFPWSDPDRFISLRDDDGNELALVPDPAHLSAHTRVALETALAEAGFIFDLQSVTELDEEVELRNWHVH
ncbi:MAG TPA: DUF1854 domain-containing protein, partial [Longimicrobiales bacterium]|nr:DUF1854 domain-containing protein [Longimicrobiales bacterium]